jgi:hypothetical protein
LRPSERNTKHDPHPPDFDTHPLFIHVIGDHAGWLFQ